LNQIILVLILFFSLFPAHGRAEVADKPGQMENNTPLPSSPASPSSGESKVVVEIPRSQWCQCVRAILGVEGGNIAGCVKSGASEEKLKIFRMRGTGDGKSSSVSYLLSLAGCTESENENVGSLTFSIKWMGPPTGSLDSQVRAPAPDAEQSSVPITCEAGGISEVVATLYHSNGVKLASVGPLNCSNPVFTLHSIPVSSSLQLMVAGKNAAGKVLYRGERDKIRIVYHETTGAGTIAATPFTPGLSAPEDLVMMGSASVRFIWSDVHGVTTYRLQASKNSNFTPLVIDASTKSASYVTTADLASGTYYWRVMAKDVFNNSGEWTTPWSFTVDADPPLNTTADKFINKGAAKTKIAEVSLAISATKKTGVAAYYISNRPEKPGVRKSGWIAIPSTPSSFEAEIPYTLSKGEGVKKIYVWFKDAWGRVSQSKSGSILLDTTSPHATITGHPAPLTNSTSARFSFVSTKKNSLFQCQLDGGVYTACTSTTTYNGLTEGSHTFTVKATEGDTDTNADPAPPSFTWTIDTTPPHSAITSYPPVLTNYTLADFSFSSTEPDSKFRCRLDGAAFADCVSPLIYSGLSSGKHTFMVVATDAANNVEMTPASYSWTIDTTPFITTITNQPPNRSTSTSASFSFTANKTGATFLCQLDNSSYSKCSSPMTYTKLTEGNHTFNVMAIESTGNEETPPTRATWVIGLPPTNTTRPGFINRKGTYFTGKNTVTLSISGESNRGITGYFASDRPETPNASDPDWVTFPAVKSYYQDVQYAMSEKTGTKKVHVWFKDSDGNVSESRSDTIYLFNAYYVVLVVFLIQVAIIL
jgi:hypothetical protein